MTMPSEQMVIGQARTDQKHYQVVIVGGGITGLAAAWSMRDRDLLLLEAADRVGGRMKSVYRDPYWVNLGHHVIEEGSAIARLARELGEELVEPPGFFLAVEMRGRIVRAARPEAMLLQLPLSLAARISLVRSGLRIMSALQRAKPPTPSTRASHPRAVPLSAERDERRSFADLLGPMHPDIEALMRVIANRVGGELGEISAYDGVKGYRFLWGGHRLIMAGGSGRLPDALRAGLGGRVLTGARVERVEQSSRDVGVEYLTATGLRRVTADACVVAVPAPIAREIVTDLPPDREEALARIRYMPFVVAGIFTGERGPMPWDDLYALAVTGRTICMFFNPGNALRLSQTRRAGGSLVVYAAGDRAARLLQESDPDIRDLFLKDLYGVFPESRGIVEDVIIQRWLVGGKIKFPGLAAVQDVLARPWGRICFAGDYLVDGVETDWVQHGYEVAETIGSSLQHLRSS